jgi:hypothetical protein
MVMVMMGDALSRVIYMRKKKGDKRVMFISLLCVCQSQSACHVRMMTDGVGERSTGARWGTLRTSE